MTAGHLLATLRLRAVRATFDFWQRLGVHVTPVHYEEAIPDTRQLPATLWEGPRLTPGLDWNGEAQRALLARLAADFRAEYAALPLEPAGEPWRFALRNGSFESVDAELLYALIRHLWPRRMLEIGSGNSTLLAAEAFRRNAADRPGASPPELVACEPWPNATLRAGVPGLTRLLPCRAQEIPAAEFAALGDGDILFIDSSHVVQTGGDVTHLLLEVVPRLAPGVIVHVHDIFLPGEYPREWLTRAHRFWTEQYLLQAFLLFNREFSVLLSGAWLATHHPDELAAAVPSFEPGRTRPGSFWMRRRAAGASAGGAG